MCLRRREEEEKLPGIQNQKQEPDTNLWGKIKKNANACGQSQRSKTQKMLASNASSPCQRVSNGYLCHPLPVPNVAF